MAGSVNKTILIGFTGEEPRVTEATGGSTQVASFSLATTERGFTRRDGTQVPERTEWHSVTAFGQLAKVVGQYVHKGMHLYVEGRLNTTRYEDKDGVRRKDTKVIADVIQFLSGRPTSPSDDGGRQRREETRSGPPLLERIAEIEEESLIPQADDLPF